MESQITVQLPDDRSYNIVIAPGGLNTVGDRLQQLPVGNKVLVISNPEIFGFYGETVVRSLEASGFQVASHLIPAGEQHKTLASIQGIYDQALAQRLERSSTLLALGGGVIGDMTGFAAASWLRGINFVQVPTSLLAMVDASVGGKTGVNHPQGKNLIGAFYQPKLVLMDPQVLNTLPEREFRAGMAEVIKYGVIWDRPLFEELAQAEGLGSFQAIAPALLQTILIRSCEAKAAVVSQDEREGGIRAILNYGHTLGHAVESLTHYGQFVHGEAVAIGMVLAGELAVQLGLWTAAEQAQQLALIERAGLPVHIPQDLDLEGILQCLQSDKKVKAGKVRFVLPTTLGAVTITDQVTETHLRSLLSPKLQTV